VTDPSSILFKAGRLQTVSRTSSYESQSPPKIELDVSDAESSWCPLSIKDRVAIATTTDVFGSETKAMKVAKKLSRETGLPLVFRTVHPAFG
jgi:hypothetical protein